MPLVFVYGTLKRGFSNEGWLEGAVLERSAATAHGYALYMVSGYPALCRTASGLVHGELYSVSPEHLKRLDHFEGVPDSYQRESIVLDDGREVEAYVVAPERVSGAVPIDGGVFTE